MTEAWQFIWFWLAMNVTWNMYRNIAGRIPFQTEINFSSTLYELELYNIYLHKEWKQEVADISDIIKF